MLYYTIKRGKSQEVLWVAQLKRTSIGTSIRPPAPAVGNFGRRARALPKNHLRTTTPRQTAHFEIETQSQKAKQKEKRHGLNAMPL